jgi:cyclopropane fatty-acyl-phospholipid synthase-like methyltransferase
MSNRYWEDFWTEHAKSTVNDHVQRQVLRTLDKKPISDAKFRELLKYIDLKIEISKEDEILDLCCGNGLFTTHFASKCKKVTGVDFVKELTDRIDLRKYNNISLFVKDVKEVGFGVANFSKVFIYAGLQYFSPKETLSLLESVAKWLQKGGLFFIGDIPDVARMWKFFNSREREKVYFDSVKTDKPLIGTWFDREWLLKLGKYAGFTDGNILSQPPDFPYAHYRFDMILKK